MPRRMEGTPPPAARNPGMALLSGKLLVASRNLDDPNFGRTVVLLIHHEPRGAFGLVLNRPGPERLDAVWRQTVERPCHLDQPLLVGGPVEGPLIALHADAERSEQEVIPGVHFTRQRDHLLELVEREARPLSVFAGYSGWSGGQLEGELARGDWDVVDADAATVFGDESSLWPRATRRAADARLATLVRVRHMPRAPDLN